MACEGGLPAKVTTVGLSSAGDVGVERAGVFGSLDGHHTGCRLLPAEADQLSGAPVSIQSLMVWIL